MMNVVEIESTKRIRTLLSNYKFGGGHYCYNIDLLTKISDGPYRMINLLKGEGALIYYTVYEDNVPIIIAPIFKKNDELFVAGGSVGFDFTDLFYSSVVDNNKLLAGMRCLLGYLKTEGFCKLRWDFLAFNSTSIELLNTMGMVPKGEVDNVCIMFDSYKDYLGGLSKNVRQNLRTAENRLLRENKNYTLLNNIEKQLPNEIVEQCVNLYCKRQKEKYRKNFISQFMIKTINFQSQMMYQQKGTFFVFMIDDEVAAFMFGYQCERSLEIPKLAIDDKFGFCSPGMILVNKTIEFLSTETDIKCLYLCRGTEIYKLRMGGKVYKTYNYLLDL